MVHQVLDHESVSDKFPIVCSQEDGFGIFVSMSLHVFAFD